MNLLNNYIKKICYILTVLVVFVGGWSFPKNFDYLSASGTFVSGAQAAYSGLTDEEKKYLKSKGYTDADISEFNSHANNYVSKGGYVKNSFSTKTTQMLKDLGDNASVWNARNKQIQEEKDEADSKNLKDFFINTLTLTPTSKNNYQLIHYAFTSIENGCWFCPVFDTLFKTVNSLAASTNEGLGDIIAGGAGSLLWILLYGYIIYVVGKAFLTSAFKEISGMDLVSQIFMPFLACLIATILIKNWQAIYTYLLDPLLIGAIGLGQGVLGKSAEIFSANANLSGITIDTTCSLSSFGNSTGLSTFSGYGGGVSINGSITTPFNNTVGLNYLRFGSTGAVSANFIDIPASGAAFSDGVGESILCFLKTLSQSLIAWMTIGATLMADCWKAKIYFIFPNIQMFIIGLIVFIGSFLIFISFPLKLLDAMFRLMFVSALMPLWIAFWVIPQTRRYTEKAWEMLIHVMVTFVILSVVLVMALQIIGTVFSKSVSGIDISELTKLLASDNASDAMEKIDFSGVGIFLATALMYMAFSLIGKAETFVGQFASGGSLGIGQAAAARVTQGAQKVGSVGVHAVGAAGRVGANGIKKAGSKVASSYRAYKASRIAASGSGPAPTPGPTPAPTPGPGPTP